MKKLLLLFFVLLYGLVDAQTLVSDNFSALNVGNIGTDVTGATAGQGNYLTFNTTGGTNGGNSNYQIVTSSNVTYGKNLQIVGSDAGTGTRFMWKDGLNALWGGRTAGNNIIEVEFDLFTGAASTSRNDFRVLIYSTEATPRIIAGLFLSKNATISAVDYVNVVRGLALATSGTTTGLFSYGLGTAASPQIVFADNTWIRLGFSFNKTTGALLFKGPGFNASVAGAGTGLDTGEMDFVSAPGSAANTVSASAAFDNYIIRASSADTLLSVEAVTNVAQFSISPNPTTDIVNISSSENINVSDVSVADLNGRIVKQLKFNNISNVQVNLSDLSAGMYMMSVTSDQGIATKKIIKN